MAAVCSASGRNRPLRAVHRGSGELLYCHQFLGEEQEWSGFVVVFSYFGGGLGVLISVVWC